MQKKYQLKGTDKEQEEKVRNVQREVASTRHELNDRKRQLEKFFEKASAIQNRFNELKPFIKDFITQ